ncbi:3-oxoadipate enol-lactonase [Polymorphum gilvum]|uniref:3-oxoadipate enol-lactonase-like and alpha/beta hydrolase superfamily domains n=1 Tax=Polymorphum gilvum (strain LMG 25793 / CGMCC 1.9160 / SL003B-26A1) TaxID=991905 RepID=F2J578_POLGS|nr:3-oxoadipate enol-lactonase [Polymorphum gilvum]ADZ71137.1 3-oxoadipate enol-lactonase-like and alpha/beta hydrolase superfamily domains [Polymorphum gilvum SL003B-26A1]
MHMLRANGLCLHVQDTGERELPPIVFANSLGTDLRSWDRVAQRLAGRFRLVRYDKRGHGLSEAPPAPYRIADHVADLAALLDALALDKVILVGLSVGGLIAQGLAATRPDLVRALMLCDTAARIGTAEMWDQRIATIERGGIAALAEPILERWFSARFRTERPEELAGWRAMLTRTPIEGYLGTCAAIRDADYTEKARRLALPVLCLCGSEDGATPPDLVRATADLIPGARFVLVDGAGHLPCIEDPDRLCAELVGFIKENKLV